VFGELSAASRRLDTVERVTQACELPGYARCGSGTVIATTPSRRSAACLKVMFPMLATASGRATMYDPAILIRSFSSIQRLGTGLSSTAYSC